MGELRISIPNEVHKALKQNAVDKEISLKQLIVSIFEDYINSKKSEVKQNKKGG